MRREPSSSDLLRAWELALPRSELERPQTVLAAVGVAEAGDLPVGRRDGELLRLRRAVFGREAPGMSTCAGCGESLEFLLDIDHLLVEGSEPDADTYDVVIGGWASTFRLPTGADLVAAHAPDAAETKQRLLERCVVSSTRNGEPVSPKALPPTVVDAISERMRAADPQAEVEVALTCPACGTSWRDVFDVGSFFWSELDGWARHLLQDVAELAGAFGWTEADVVALTPTRRQAYLELAGR